LFTDDERGFGQVIGDGTVAPDGEATARAAVMACPEHAVTCRE
jgi:ferredoxin